MPLIRKPVAELRVSEHSAALAEALRHGDVTARFAAARAVGDLNVLAAALRTETEPSVREAIFTGLARLNSVGSFAVLAGVLRSEAAAERNAALEAMKLMPAPAAAVLPGLLRDADVDVRVLACELARIAPGGEALLAQVLAHETEENICAAAAEVLAEIGSAASVANLRECAARFGEAPFLEFAIGVACRRIEARLPNANA